MLVRTGSVTKFDVGDGFSVDYRSPRYRVARHRMRMGGLFGRSNRGVWAGLASVVISIVTVAGFSHDLPTVLRAAVVQIHGLSFWDWSVTNGLIGLIAGIAGYFLLEHAGPSQRVVRASIIVSLAVIVGVAATVTDLLMGSTFFHSSMAGCLPTVFNVELAAPLLLPILDQL
jgi:energy-coupling factor transport system substrate-specific component